MVVVEHESKRLQRKWSEAKHTAALEKHENPTLFGQSLRVRWTQRSYWQQCVLGPVNGRRCRNPPLHPVGWVTARRCSDATYRTRLAW